MRPKTDLLLLFGCAILILTVWQPAAAERRSVAARHRLPTCPAKYPTAQLLTAPACKERRRQRRGRPLTGCGKRLRLGARTYPVSWSIAAAGDGKLTSFGLALSGPWRRRSLTIWRGRVFARRGRHGKWRVVYQLSDSGRLVTADPGAKPPCRPARGQRRAAAEKSSATGAGDMRVRCHGNECRVRLSLKALLRRAAQLMRGRRGRRRRSGDVELRLRLAVVGSRRRSRARFVSGRLALVDESKAERRRQPRGGGGRKTTEVEDDAGAAAYRRFVDRRRKQYWRKEGWRVDDDGEKAKKEKRPERRRSGRDGPERRRRRPSGDRRKADGEGDGGRDRRDREERRRVRKPGRREDEERRPHRSSRGDDRRRSREGGRQFKRPEGAGGGGGGGEDAGARRPRSIGLFDFKDD